MASVRKVDKLENELAAKRKSAAKKTRDEKQAQLLERAVEIPAAVAGGAAAGALNHYYGADGEPHKVGPFPTNALLGLGAAVGGAIAPRKFRLIGAGLSGTGLGMIGHATGRFTEDRLEEMEEDD
jgi:hypothetical protein